MIALLPLLHRFRDAETVEELAFIAVNETLGLLPYRQAVLWEEERGVTALSGVPDIERNAPFVQWLERVCRALKGTGLIEADALKERERLEWSEWFPASGFWVALPKARAGLLIVRDEPWTEQDAAVLSEIGHACDHAWIGLRRPTPWRDWKRRATIRRGVALALALGLVATAFFPVPLTVLAPAEVVAAHPAVIRAPLDGVVSRLHVRPNQSVIEGQLLFELDDATLKSKVEVAEKALVAVEAELRQMSQQAVFDPSAKPKLAAIVGRREQQAAELDYLKGLQERIQVKAPAEGVAILDDPSEWIGRPVSVGEKVLSLADARDTEIEAWLAPADVIALGADAPVTVFLNVAPLAPQTAKLSYIAYEASARPDGSIAYRVRARIEGTEKPRLGLRGTARLSGDTVPLIYWLLRRPLVAIRGWIGL